MLEKDIAEMMKLIQKNEAMNTGQDDKASVKGYFCFKKSVPNNSILSVSVGFAYAICVFKAEWMSTEK